MAMAALTVKYASRAAGLDLTAANMENAGAGGDTFPPGSDMWLRVKNAGASPCTVTVDQPTGSGPLGTSITDLALAPAVPITTGDRLFGPFPAYPFADPADGLIHVTYSSTSSVTVQAIRLTG
jgi:hypothetical protein